MYFHIFSSWAAVTDHPVFSTKLRPRRLLFRIQNSESFPKKLYFYFLYFGIGKPKYAKKHDFGGGEANILRLDQNRDYHPPDHLSWDYSLSFKTFKPSRHTRPYGFFYSGCINMKCVRKTLTKKS